MNDPFPVVTRQIATKELKMDFGQIHFVGKSEETWPGAHFGGPMAMVWLLVL